MSYEAIKEAITTAGFVAVRLPAKQNCSEFSLWTEDGTKWVYSHNSDGDTPITVTADGTSCLPLALSIYHGIDVSTGNVLCYAKGTTSTNIVGLVTKP